MCPFSRYDDGVIGGRWHSEDLSKEKSGAQERGMRRQAREGKKDRE